MKRFDPAPLSVSEIMIEAILFDFNGVVINDEHLQLNAYKDVLRTYDIELTEAQYYGALGLDDSRFVSTIFRNAGKELIAGLSDELISAKSEIHRRLIENELPFFPGVLTFLKATSRRFAIGLVSMARRTEIDFVLERARLNDLFSVIISAEDVQECKPDPECYQCALKKLNDKRQLKRLLPLLPGECLVIEDAPPGIRSARGAGMKTLGISNTVTEAELRNAGADVVTTSLFDWTTDAVHRVFEY